MNLGAIARSLSSSLRIGLGSKTQLKSSTAENPIKHESSSTSIFSRSSSSSTSGSRSSAGGGHQLHYKKTLEAIQEKIGELEHTLYEDQQQQFKLRMSLEGQTERIDELNFSLESEKQRNERLVQLLRGMDTESASDTEPEMNDAFRMPSSHDILGSISPLLMQQRYEELSASHRQIHRQLAKKDKAIKLAKCDLEELRGKYDSMLDDYRQSQRCLETLCSRYKHLQQKKKQQINTLKETLGYASECILQAQRAIESRTRGHHIDGNHLLNFNLNLKHFMRSLRNCCCVRKLQELQMQQGMDVNGDLQQQQLQSEAAPSVDSNWNLVAKRHERHSHKL